MIRIFRAKFITPIKQFVKLVLVNVKYNTGYFDSPVPKSFKEKRGLQIEKNVFFSNQNIKIGKYCFVGQNTRIDNCSEIGAFSCISSDVKIGVVNHALDHISTNPFFYSKTKGWVEKTTYNKRADKTVKIGADVLISSNAIIIEGVEIGIGAVIAAGAVVNKSVPPYAIVGGVPAKVIKYRFNEEIRKRMIDSKWWKLPENELIKNSKFFNNPELFLSQIIK